MAVSLSQPQLQVDSGARPESRARTTSFSVHTGEKNRFRSSKSRSKLRPESAGVYTATRQTMTTGQMKSKAKSNSMALSFDIGDGLGDGSLMMTVPLAAVARGVQSQSP